MYRAMHLYTVMSHAMMFWSIPDCINNGASVYDYNGAERFLSPSEVVAIVI